jgi:small subunit ribosomal protein S17
MAEGHEETTEEEQEQPTVEAEAPAEAPEAEAEAEAPSTEPATRARRKRLPRSARRQRSKPKREPAKKRAPLSRAPKPERVRGARQERRGVVVSSAMDKTIVVRVETRKAHPRYKKIIRRSTRFHAHDERNEANVGDLVRIVETRPLSRTKHWRLAEIIEAAK